ncbi:MAG: enoyl-CoA hydratase-related protein [Dehalobacterium sp.]
MDYKNLILTIEDGLAVIAINRPKVYNALNSELQVELEQILWDLEKDPQVRVVIVTGSIKAFAAGADVSELADADPIEAYENFSLAHRVFDRLEALPFPTIAAVNGPALGGGCELALSCDFRIAGENAMFGLPEVSLGIIPGAGGTQRLARLIGFSRAKEMIFLGKPIKAPQALAIGLVNQVVADEEVLNEAKKMAAKLMERPGVALRFAKESINYGLSTDLISGKNFEKTRGAMLFSTHDQKEGMKAFIEKRKPNYLNK